MPTKTRLLIEKASVNLTLLPDRKCNVVMDDPRLTDFTPNTVVWWYWDADALRIGRREFLGIEVSNIGVLKESDFVAIERLNLPRVECTEIGLPDASVTEVLRLTRRKYVSSPDAFDQNRRAMGTNTSRPGGRDTSRDAR